MSLVPLPLGLVGCCCCCPGDRLGPPGVGAENGNGAVAGFSPGEEDTLANAARSWMRDTGRTCGDFFETLRSPGRADAFLAGRPTLLTKVRDLEAFEALALSTTVCAVVGVGAAPPAVTPQLRRPPAMAPTRITATFRNLDPFGTPRGVLFRGTIGEYFAWKNSLQPRIRGGFVATARDDFDGSLFDEFCHGPACP